MVRMMPAPSLVLVPAQIGSTATACHHQFHHTPPTTHAASRRFWIWTFNPLPYASASGLQFVDSSVHVVRKSVCWGEYGGPDIARGFRRLDNDFRLSNAHSW